jgi:hypothetical protein
MSENSTAYTLTLKFPECVDPEQVTQVDYQVTSVPVAVPPLDQNQMPASMNIGDTLTFTYKKANKGVKIKSCMLTRFNLDDSTKETDEDFESDFDKPITITPAFLGSWIFHLLGLYKSNDKQAAYYLDPEATFKQG